MLWIQVSELWQVKMGIISLSFTWSMHRLNNQVRCFLWSFPLCFFSEQCLKRLFSLECVQLPNELIQNTWIWLGFQIYDWILMLVWDMRKKCYVACAPLKSFSNVKCTIMTVIRHIVEIWKKKEHLLICFGIILKVILKLKCGQIITTNLWNITKHDVILYRVGIVLIQGLSVVIYWQKVTERWKTVCAENVFKYNPHGHLISPKFCLTVS